jgi:hypothetical protein
MLRNKKNFLRIIFEFPAQQKKFAAHHFPELTRRKPETPLNVCLIPFFKLSRRVFKCFHITKTERVT